MKKFQAILWYGVLVVLSLFIIFFVGKNDEGKRIITTDGLQHFKKWMDVAWWVRLTYKIDLSTYEQNYTNPQEYASIVQWIKDIILQNIDRRISALWVSDYNSYIQTLDDGEYVVVEIGWVFDIDQAKEIIWKTVELEFKTLYEWDGSDVYDARKILAENILRDASQENSLFAEYASWRSSDAIYYRAYTDVTKDSLPPLYQNEKALFSDTREIGSLYPTLLEWLYAKAPVITWSAEALDDLSGFVIVKWNGVSTIDLPIGTWEETTTQKVYSFEEIFVSDTPEWVLAKDPKTGKILNGAYFKQAGKSVDQTGRQVVTIDFDETWKDIFCNITEQIIGKQMAIFVWWNLETAPVIRSKICGWTAQIDGDFTWTPCGVEGIPATDHVTWVTCLMDNLNDGALPAKLVLAHEEKISASLGERALQGALLAWVVWLTAVFLYMMTMYWFKKAFVALTSLLVFLVVLIAVIKLIWFALSLSGIAAILLSIGMGVDANVLIYERVREEVAMKKGMWQAIVDGYKRSWSAIRDGNVTTLMIAILLVFMWTNVFKWFGLMMLINILLTLVLVVPLTKHLLLLMYGEQK